VRVFDVRTGEVRRTFPGTRRNASRSNLALSPDGTRLVHLRDDAAVIRDTASWEVVREIEGWTFSMAFSRDGSRWARMQAHGIEVHETSRWEESAHLERAGFRAGNDELALDGRRLLAIVQGVVEVWDLDERRCARDSLGPRHATSLAISPGGRLAAVGTRSGSLSLWDLEELRELSTAAAHGQWLLTVAFSPGGRLLASGGGDQRIRLWDVSGEPPALKPAGVLSGHQNELWSVSFSADGRRLISGSKDATVKVWPAKAPEADYVELPCAPGTFACGFSADGSLFRTRAPSREIQVWRSRDGRLVQTLPVREGSIGDKDRRREWPLWKGDRLYVSIASGEVETWEVLPRREGPLDPARCGVAGRARCRRPR
jgi:WD40 repeat protein